MQLKNKNNQLKVIFSIFSKKMAIFLLTCLLVFFIQARTVMAQSTPPDDCYPCELVVVLLPANEALPTATIEPTSTIADPILSPLPTLETMPTEQLTEPTANNTPVSALAYAPPDNQADSPALIMTKVITTADCNDSCSQDSDCSNISHICYQGFCRLDVNPNDVNCRLINGNNIIERSIDVPTDAGFVNWFNFLKAGLGLLGFGALLLLLL